MSAYRITMRTKKWWWPLFAYTLDLAIQNGWLLYRKTPSWQHRPLDLLAFRRDVVRVYLMRHAQPAIMRRPGRPQALTQRVPEEVRLDNRGHFFADSPTQRRCANCKRTLRNSALNVMWEYTSTVSMPFMALFDYKAHLTDTMHVPY